MVCDLQAMFEATATLTRREGAAVARRGQEIRRGTSRREGRLFIANLSASRHRQSILTGQRRDLAALKVCEKSASLLAMWSAPINYSDHRNNSHGRETNMQIGTRVRLIKDVDNYPTCLIHAGETGHTHHRRRHLLDQARPASPPTRRVGKRTGNLGLVSGGSGVSPDSIIGGSVLSGISPSRLGWFRCCRCHAELQIIG
jgi:hypothetical protein